MKTGLIHEHFLLAFNNDLSLGMIRVAGQQPPVSWIRKAWMGKTSDWLKISEFLHVCFKRLGTLYLLVCWGDSWESFSGCNLNS